MPSDRGKTAHVARGHGPAIVRDFGQDCSVDPDFRSARTSCTVARQPHRLVVTVFVTRIGPSPLTGLDSRTPQRPADCCHEPRVRGTGTATDITPTDAHRSPRDRPRYGD